MAVRLRIPLRRTGRCVRNERTSPCGIRCLAALVSAAFPGYSARLLSGGKPSRPYRLREPWPLDWYDHEIFLTLSSRGYYCDPAWTRRQSSAEEPRLSSPSVCRAYGHRQPARCGGSEEISAPA